MKKLAWVILVSDFEILGSVPFNMILCWTSEAYTGPCQANHEIFAIIVSFYRPLSTYHHAYKKDILTNFAKFRPEACNFVKKETLAKVFSCKFYEICNNTFFTEHLWVTAPDIWHASKIYLRCYLTLWRLVFTKMSCIFKQTLNKLGEQIRNINKTAVINNLVANKMC